MAISTSTAGPDLTTSGGARLAGVDAARWLLCFAVATLHALPRPDMGTPSMATVGIATACRAAVPFFFVASGYFAKQRSLLDPLKRLGPAYVAWLVLYNLTAGAAEQLLHPRAWLTGGSAIHLWFVPALIVALTVVPALVKQFGVKITGLLCLFAAGVNLALDAYRPFVGLPEVGGARLIMAPLLVFAGMMLNRHQTRLSLPIALGVLSLTWTAALAEETALATLSKGVPISHAAVVSTYLMGVSAFLAAEAIGRAPRWMARLGRISFGVYASHLLFVNLFASKFGCEVPAKLMLAMVSVAAATLLSMALDRIKATRWLVEPRLLRKG